MNLISAYAQTQILSPFLSPAPHFPGCLPSQPPLILLCEFRWPFGRRATKTHKTPVFQQADTHTYYSTLSTSTSPSPLCPLPTSIHTHTPQPPPPPTHKLIRHKKRRLSVTENSWKSAPPPKESLHALCETRTSPPSASILGAPNTHARGRPPSMYRTFKMTEPRQIATIRPEHHAHNQKIPGYLHARIPLQCSMHFDAVISVLTYDMHVLQNP